MGPCLALVVKPAGAMSRCTCRGIDVAQSIKRDQSRRLGERRADRWERSGQETVVTPTERALHIDGLSVLELP